MEFYDRRQFDADRLAMARTEARVHHRNAAGTIRKESPERMDRWQMAAHVEELHDKGIPHTHAGAEPPHDLLPYEHTH